MSKDRVSYFKVAKIKVILPSKIMQRQIIHCLQVLLYPINVTVTAQFCISDKDNYHLSSIRRPTHFRHLCSF